MNSAESRRHPRVRSDAHAPIRVDVMGKGFLDVLYASDISVSGLGLSVPHGFSGCDIDEEVELIVTLGRARPFKAQGKIRHRSESLDASVFGVEFCRLSAEKVALIEAYVDARLKRAVGG